MNKQTRYVTFVVTVLLVLAMSMLWAVPVLADGGKPPVRPDRGTDPVPSRPQHEKHSTSELLSRMPKGTQIVVLNSRGRVISLASQDAADALDLGQVIWCPASVGTPVNGGSCSPANTNTSLAAVISWLTNKDPGVAGVIWLQSTYISSAGDAGVTSFTLSGSDPNFTTANFALTIKGGWNGPGTKTIDTADLSIFNGASLNITDWKANVTLSDLIIEYSTNSSAINVTTTKDITLNRIQSVSNTAQGAYLNNQGGTGNVNITASIFNNNSAGAGVELYSRGTITLKDITAGGNSGYGMYLVNSLASTPKNVTLSGLNTFNNNGHSGPYGGSGLYISSKGAITVSDLTAVSNENAGAYFVNNISGATAGVTLTGTSIFNGNGGTGLVIDSNSAIKLSNINAGGNLGSGAELDNSQALTAQPVTLTGTNIFNVNSDDGLIVSSKGAITISNLTANSNAGGDGADLYNAVSGGTGGVTLLGPSAFSNNYYDGLHIYSHGAVTLGNVNASGNGISLSPGSGLSIDISGASKPVNVTLTGINIFNNNYGSGLDIQSKGIINVANITASNNNDGGAYFGYAKAVTLTGTNIFNSNGYSGLFVEFAGTVTLSNLTANENTTTDGIIIQATGTITLTNLTANENTSGNGMYIETLGAITTTNLTAIENGNPGSPGSGVVITNESAATPASVTLNGTNFFDGNYTSGLVINSKGAIKVNNLTANNSTTSNGAILDNSLGSATAGITLTGYGNFTKNGDDGLEIKSNGAVSLTRVNADSNSQYGLLVTTNGNVTLTCGSFVKNKYGVNIFTLPGTVTLKGVDAYNTSGNYYISAAKTITVRACPLP